MSDNKQVGVHRVPGSSKSGQVLFGVLRLTTPVIQYALFTSGWGVKIATTIGLSANTASLKVGPGLGGLGSLPTLLVALYTGGAFRQVYWLLSTNQYEWPHSQALQVAGFNTLFDTINTLFTINTLATAGIAVAAAAVRPNTLEGFLQALEWKQYIGLALYAIGLIFETRSEHTRAVFKSKPENKGKIDDTGLWSVVRHANYLFYNVYRTGLSLVTGSTALAAGYFALQTFQFANMAIPELSQHMKERYGAQWEAYEKKVPYKLYPYIY